MSKILIAALIALTAPAAACAQTRLVVPASVQNASAQPFYSHRGPGPFDTSLALNVPYGPVREARGRIGEALGLRLDYFKAWDPLGEAHVTVVTPVEYWDTLRHKLSIEEIETIALNNDIQGSDLKLLGVGSGRALLEGRREETFFFVVKSDALLRIRREIQRVYAARGGRPGDFQPEVFYPHVTIGYTKRDLHLQDGVIKDMPHSEDKRFALIVR